MPRLRAIGRTVRLRQLLYAYAAEVLDVLRENGEWPVPFGTMLDLGASHAILSSPGERPTANTLSAYLRSGQIGQALEATGHRWIWHREVIGDLFVERVLARTFAHHEQLDPSVLGRVFRRLCTELKTPTLKLRHVLVVHGFPVLPKELHTSSGVRLIPFDMATGYGALWTLLGSEYQRDVRKWGGGNGLFAVVDEIIHKSGEPDDIRAAAERINEKAAYALGALRLAYEGIVRVSRSYFVHVSEFPLLPPSREDIQGVRRHQPGVGGRTWR